MSERQAAPEAPARITSRDDELGVALRRWRRATQAGPADPAAFAAIAGRARRGRARGLVLGGGLVAAAAAVALALWPSGGGAPPAPVAAPVAARPPAPVAAPAAARPPEPVAAPIAVGPAARRLPAGALRVGAGTRLDVGAGAELRARRRGTGLELALARGRVRVAVGPPDGGRIRVVAGPYALVDVGTVFVVERGPAEVTLEVEEGAVRVERGGREIALVARGPAAAPARWTGPIAPAAARPAPPDAAGACEIPAPPAPLAGALACLAARAAGRGLAAEAALHDLGRLRRDRLADLPGALAAFDEQRRRFPDGALAPEAELSIVELLPRLGRHREALAAAARLLARAPQGPRADELRLLRGDVLRAGLDDCAAALREYAGVRDEAGGAGDAAAFSSALCLERLGRAAEAADALRRYLARPDARRAAEARARLGGRAP